MIMSRFHTMRMYKQYKQVEDIYIVYNSKIVKDFSKLEYVIVQQNVT